MKIVTTLSLVAKVGKRQRRRPEEARALILEAARKVIGELGPDRAGLKQVAESAGVSHGLVTHYFGTFDNLVEAVFAEHALELNKSIAAEIARLDSSPDGIVEFVLSKLSDPSFGRLIVWALLSGRIDRDDFFPLRQQGPRALANAIEARIRARGDAMPPREEIESLLILISCVGIGYSLGRSLYWGGLGHRPNQERDKAFRRFVADLIKGRLEPEK